MLQSFGYDFWLNLAGLNSYEWDYRPINLDFEALKQIISWVNMELCCESKQVMMYPPNNIKFVTNSHKLNRMDIGESINYVKDMYVY